MNDQIQKAQAFNALHVKGAPLVLYNIWDAGTANIIAKAGAKAIATGSWAVASAHGFEDGELIPLEAALENLRCITKTVNLPVTIDLEAGYGQDPSTIAATVSAAIKCGAIGFNLEDQIIGAGKLYDIDAQCARISAARKAADGLGVPAFLNARTDTFFQAHADDSMDTLLQRAIERAKAYHDAGADGIFVPGLTNENAIEKICTAAALPVNIMMLPGCPQPAHLAQLGVSRISYGPGPYLVAMETVSQAAQALYS